MFKTICRIVNIQAGKNPIIFVAHFFALQCCSHIYWCSAWNGGYRIEEARLDGKERRTVIDNLGHVTSMTLDYENNWLYFADSLVHTIERIDFNGKNRKKLLTNVANPQALTLYNRSIYFGDWKTKSVGRADKDTGQNRTRILNNLEFVMDLLTYHKSRQTGMLLLVIVIFQWFTLLACSNRNQEISP